LKIFSNYVINMKEMFNGCKSLMSIDLHSFDTSLVTNMERMFSGCNSLEEINLINFNTSSVNNMKEMFNECNKAKKIDIISFDTYLVENMYHIFYGCNSLEKIDVSNFILYKLQNQIKDLFGNIENNSMLMQLYKTFKKIKNEENIIKDIDTNIVMEINLLSNDETDKYSETKETQILGENQIKQLSKSVMYIDNQETKLTGYYKFPDKNKEHHIKIILEGKLNSTSWMFYGCKNMEIKFTKDLNYKGRKIFDKSKIKDMSFMFFKASNISIDLSIFNTKYVENMRSLFSQFKTDKIMNISSFDTSSVTNMEYMFHYSNIKSLDLSSFNTSLVTNMRNMFYFSRESSLDLSSFDTSLVTDMQDMFFFFIC